jgi:hypothetical protein
MDFLGQDKTENPTYASHMLHMYLFFLDLGIIFSLGMWKIKYLDSAVFDHWQWGSGRPSFWMLAITLNCRSGSRFLHVSTCFYCNRPAIPQTFSFPPPVAPVVLRVRPLVLEVPAASWTQGWKNPTSVEHLDIYIYSYILYRGTT